MYGVIVAMIAALLGRPERSDSRDQQRRGEQESPDNRRIPGNPSRLRRLLAGAGAPVSLDECWVSFRGEVLATGWVEFGQFKCRRVFN